MNQAITLYPKNEQLLYQKGRIYPQIILGITLVKLNKYK